jgi:CheY-like chemotaxis protein
MRKHLLVIDDNFFCVKTAVSFFKKHGYSVSSASNGKEGLETATKNPPDFIIVDLKMPLMDGAMFTRELHKRPDTMNIPVLMLSGEENSACVQDLINSDPAFMGFINKPAALPEIAQIIQDTLKPRRE